MLVFLVRLNGFHSFSTEQFAETQPTCKTGRAVFLRFGWLQFLYFLGDLKDVLKQGMYYDSGIAIPKLLKLSIKRVCNYGFFVCVISHCLFYNYLFNKAVGLSKWRQQ